MLGGESERVAVAGGERGGIGLVAAAHDWADGVDDVFCGQPAGSGDGGLTGWQAAGKLRGAQFAAVFENAWAAATVDGAVHAASAEKGAVGALTMASTGCAVMSPTRMRTRPSKNVCRVADMRKARFGSV